MLGAEISILSSTMFGVLIYHIVKCNKGIATWHRSVMGKMIRNIFISGLFEISLILSVFYIETTKSSVLIHSVSTIAAPLVALSVISIIKVIFLHTSKTLFWLMLNILVLLEIAILIIKEDYDYELSWITSLICLVLLFLDHMVTCIVSAYRNKRKLENIFAILGSLSGGVSLTCLAMHLDGHVEKWHYFVILGWTTLVFLSLAYTKRVGNWVVNTLFSHIEFEYMQIKKRNNARAKSADV